MCWVVLNYTLLTAEETDAEELGWRCRGSGCPEARARGKEHPVSPHLSDLSSQRADSCRHSPAQVFTPSSLLYASSGGWEVSRIQTRWESYCIVTSPECHPTSSSEEKIPENLLASLALQRRQGCFQPWSHLRAGSPPSLRPVSCDN